MSLEVARLSSEELGEAIPLLAPEGWTFEARELARLHALGGAVGAREGGRLVGFLSFVDTPPCRWIGNVAVDASLRGRGVGARLVAEAMRGADRVALYSVEKAVPLYERAGFVPAGELHALRAEAARPSSIPYAGVVPAREQDLPDIEALDREVTAMDRSRLLRALLAAYPARVVRHHGRLLGFAVAKTYADVTGIGPVVAQTPHAAWGLVDDLLRATHGPHDLAAHAMTGEARRRGFSPLFRAVPMFHGGAPAWDLARYHSAAGLEKG